MSSYVTGTLFQNIFCTLSALTPLDSLQLHIHTSDVCLILACPGTSAVHSDHLNIEFYYSFSLTHGGRVISLQVFTMGCNRTWAHVSTNGFFFLLGSPRGANSHSDGYRHSSPNRFWTLLSVGCFHHKTFAAHTATVHWRTANYQLLTLYFKPVK